MADANMFICDEGHEQIVHTRYWNECPLCEALSKVEELENKLKDKDREFEELEEETNGLNNDMSFLLSLITLITNKILRLIAHLRFIPHLYQGIN